MDSFFLQRALELASSRKGFCAPNPAVGAVIVRNGVIIAEGTHQFAGAPHAEIEALSKASASDCAGATLYVSLEPCCHFGRTPPCTDAILERRFARVVYAFSDPNPVVAGKGHAILEQAGIQVAHVPLAEADAFYQGYKHWTLTRTPFVTAKLAISLDGKTAGRGGAPIALTGPQTNRFTHLNRLQNDAILTTARTILADNPRLNARLEGEPVARRVIILDRLCRTPPSARIFETASEVSVYTSEDTPNDRRTALKERGAQVITLATPGPSGHLPLQTILGHLGERGFHGVWVEGGAAVFTAFLREKLAQKAYLYLAPVIVGRDGIDAFESDWEHLLYPAKVTWTPQGRDVIAEMVW